MTYLGLATNSHQEIVKVHNGMDTKVDGAENQPSGCLIDPSMPAAVEDRNVVVPVQKDQRLLVDHNEKGVE